MFIHPISLSTRDSARSKPWAGGRQELDRDLHPRKVIAKPRGRVKAPHSVGPSGVRGGPDPGHVHRPDSRGLQGPKPTGEFWGDQPRSGRDEGPGALTPQPAAWPEQRREAEATVQLVWAMPRVRVEGTMQGFPAAGSQDGETEARAGRQSLCHQQPQVFMELLPRAWPPGPPAPAPWVYRERTAQRPLEVD